MFGGGTVGTVHYDLCGCCIWPDDRAVHVAPCGPAHAARVRQALDLVRFDAVVRFQIHEDRSTVPPEVVYLLGLRGVRV